MNLKSTDQLKVTNGCLKVNGLPFVVDFPDKILCDIIDNRLVTISHYKLCVKREALTLKHYWKPEEIEGYYA